MLAIQEKLTLEVGVSHIVLLVMERSMSSNILVIGGGNLAVEEAVYLTKFPTKSLVQGAKKCAAKVAQKELLLTPKLILYGIR